MTKIDISDKSGEQKWWKEAIVYQVSLSAFYLVSLLRLCRFILLLSWILMEMELGTSMVSLPSWIISKN